MTIDSVQKRYDEFQQEAVAAIEADYRENPAGRFLLVIPTGGGKTFTAVKAVNRLFQTEVLDRNATTVLWVAHRDLLLEQAAKTFRRFEELFADKPSFRGRVQFAMSGEAGQRFQRDPSIGLVVIDEAHHAAAKSYLPLFGRKEVGVLGLTATPSRHDGAPLEFERETFSIGFPDLVETGVILRPEVKEIAGLRFDITDFDDRSAGVFDNVERNQRIIRELCEGRTRYNKVVIYVGTVDHVKSLYRQMRDSPLADYYDSIAYITGNENSRGCDRDTFLAKEKQLRRCILVNVFVLAEGYDDPSVDTVVMAMPTKSKLVYMQCMGRAIRRDPENPEKIARIIEVADELPNIRYRIDNRWLYADVSDLLEPEVVDVWYESEKELRGQLKTVCANYRVPEARIPELSWDQHDRYGLFLFKTYVGEGKFERVPILVSKHNRRAVLEVFNFLSERAPRLKAHGWALTAVEQLMSRFKTPDLTAGEVRRCVVEAVLNAAEPHAEEPSKVITDAYPWITYVSFRYRRISLPEGLEEFLRDVVNRENIIEQVREAAYAEGSHVFKAPLPLSSFTARIVSRAEAIQLKQYVDGLLDLRDAVPATAQAERVREYVCERAFPLEQRYLDATVTIVRESSAYLFALP